MDWKYGGQVIHGLQTVWVKCQIHVWCILLWYCMSLVHYYAAIDCSPVIHPPINCRMIPPKANTVVPLSLKDTIAKGHLSNKDRFLWPQVLWMPLIPPLTKGHSSNENNIYLAEGGPYEMGLTVGLFLPNTTWLWLKPGYRHDKWLLVLLLTMIRDQREWKNMSSL